jgi:Uncharacterized protein conserved in bacteria (DUF2326).
MFLKQLIIRKGDEIIRDITFRMGVNLIVDETDSENKTESGNNVGKTTVFRLIDFCLDGDGKNIYADPEFKIPNVEIEDFLKQNKVRIILVLSSDFYNDDNDIVIEREFAPGDRYTRKINGQLYKATDFSEELKRLIFHNTSEKPTFRQLISKNIRYERNRLENTVKVLHYNSTKEVYESLYCFWLGIDFSESGRKQQLQTQINIEENFQKKMKRTNDLRKIGQALSVINTNIDELNTKKENFELNEDYSADIEALNRTKFDISQIATEISRLEIRKDLILENAENFNMQQASIDHQLVKQLYNEAKFLVPDLHHSFEETLNFHNNMICQKIQFLTKELPGIESNITSLKAALNTFLKQENMLSNKLKKGGLVEGLETIISELNIQYERKGNFEEQKRLLIESLERLQKYKEEYNQINTGLFNKQDLIGERIKHFNHFFSKLSKELYNEEFILIDEYDERAMSLKVDTTSTNPGTGKKKGQIAAFDLAYIQFADSLGVDCLHFILQDQLETVHTNQLTSLFTNVVENINCQYVMTILKNSLPTDIDNSPYIILKLSQSQKLFGV